MPLLTIPACSAEAGGTSNRQRWLSSQLPVHDEPVHFDGLVVDAAGLGAAPHRALNGSRPGRRVAADLLGDRTHELRPGSHVCFPAGQAVGHALLNRGTSVCRYLLVGERNPHDVVVYPDTGRIGVRLTGEGYRKSAVMDYWEGEDVSGAAWPPVPRDPTA